MIVDIDKKINEIFDKEFKNSLKGYNKKEVDIYLDDICETLENISKDLKQQQQDNDNILKENLALKSEIIKMEKKLREQNKNREVDELVLESKLNKMEEQLKILRNNNL